MTRRIGGVSAVLLSLLALATPAYASEESNPSGAGLGTGLTLLIFLGIPLAVFGLIALLVYGPSLLRRPRYRPGRTDWSYPPVWVGGPADPEAALTATPADVVIDVRGGGARASW
jgi:hypothetical protein